MKIPGKKARAGMKGGGARYERPDGALYSSEVEPEAGWSEAVVIYVNEEERKKVVDGEEKDVTRLTLTLGIEPRGDATIGSRIFHNIDMDVGWLVRDLCTVIAPELEASEEDQDFNPLTLNGRRFAVKLAESDTYSEKLGYNYYNVKAVKKLEDAEQLIDAEESEPEEQLF